MTARTLLASTALICLLSSPAMAEFALDARYVDADGDMVADIPTDAAGLVDPDTLIFAYSPVEDPVVYAEVWTDFLTHMEEATGKSVQFFPVDSNAAQMPFGALKRLEIARALATRPSLLLLDEPAAGLNHTETGEISDLIKKIAGSGLTVVLVEHDMKMVMHISNHVTVLNYGTKLASGTVAEVRQNPAVISAYLGTTVQQEK